MALPVLIGSVADFGFRDPHRDSFNYAMPDLLDHLADRGRAVALLNGTADASRFRLACTSIASEKSHERQPAELS